MEMDSRVEKQEKVPLEELMRERIRAAIEAIVDEELEAALGAGRSAGGLGSRRLSAREAGANVEHQPGSDDDSDAGGTVGGRRRKEPGMAQPDDSTLPTADRAGG